MKNYKVKFLSVPSWRVIGRTLSTALYWTGIRGNNLKHRIYLKSNNPRWFMLLLLAVLLQPLDAHSNHIAGGQWEYTFLDSAGGRYYYLVKYHFLVDCEANDDPDDVELGSLLSEVVTQEINDYARIVNANTGVIVDDLEDKLFLESINVYPEDCACENGALNGYRRYVFSGEIELTSGDYIFQLLDFVRNEANNTNPTTQPFFVDAYIHAPLGMTNNSATFSNPLAIFPLEDQVFTYDHQATDSDGDFLQFQLVQPKTGPSTLLNYATTGYSYTDPMGADGDLLLNQNTGIVSGIVFSTPKAYALAFKIWEYRNWQLVGWVVRDMQIYLTEGNNTNPVLSGIDGSGNYSIQGYAGVEVCFEVFGSDPDEDDGVTLSTSDLDLVLPAATFNVTSNGTPSPSAEFCWTPSLSDVGNSFCFTIQAEDNGCENPLQSPPAYNGLINKTYCISVLPCEECLPSFSPEPGKKYILSAWVRESEFEETTTTYPNAVIKVESNIGEIDEFSGSGQIIDGWQRIEGEFLIPSNATELIIKLDPTEAGTAWFDDIRVFPVDGSMKSYVYDPETLRLVAELDERNYATIYEYDEEGKLTRVKKETERGIMTIQETKTAASKKED